MAGAVQWTIDQFWGQLQKLKSQIDAVDAALNTDKARLGTLYKQLQSRYDPSADAFVAPAIHQNTVLRLTYLKPIKDDFRKAVNAASGVIRSAGYTTPTLSGLGVLPAVPVIAVTLVIACLSAVAIVWRMTQAQVNRTNAMLAIYQDPNTTADQKLALAKSMKDQIDADNRTPPPLGFNLGDVTTLAAIVAVIVIAPSVLRMLPGRRTAA